MRRQVRRYRYCKRRRLHRSGRSAETRYLKSTLRSRQRSVQTCTESSRIPDKRLKNEGKKEVRSQESKKSKPVLKALGRPIPARNELQEGPLSEAQRIKLRSSAEERGALRLRNLSLRFVCASMREQWKLRRHMSQELRSVATSDGRPIPARVTSCRKVPCQKHSGSSCEAARRSVVLYGSETYPSEELLNSHSCGRPPDSNPWNRGLFHLIGNISIK